MKKLEDKFDGRLANIRFRRDENVRRIKTRELEEILRTVRIWMRGVGETWCGVVEKLAGGICCATRGVFVALPLQGDMGGGHHLIISPLLFARPVCLALLHVAGVCRRPAVGS
jgi:hypothetical protein